MTISPRLSFSHFGLCVTDLEKCEEFYTDFLGLTVSDRGEAAGMRLVFLTSNPDEHHEVVLSEGRPPGLPQNEKNPFFGPVVNQISFRVDDLGALRHLYDRVVDAGIEPILPANHGISLSVYFPDPEGNVIEGFVDTPHFCQQPVMEPLDFEMSNDEIAQQAEQLCEHGVDFAPIERWRAQMAAKMGLNT